MSLKGAAREEIGRSSSALFHLLFKPRTQAPMKPLSEVREAAEEVGGEQDRVLALLPNEFVIVTAGAVGHGCPLGPKEKPHEGLTKSAMNHYFW